MAAYSNTVRTVALAAVTLLAVFFVYMCGFIHQALISESMEINEVEGWSFVIMTWGSYVSMGLVVAASYLLWRGRHRKAALRTLIGVGVFMTSMIGMYFYVHAPMFEAAPLPFGVEHEPLGEAGTAAVWSEVLSIGTLLLIWVVSTFQPKPVGGSQDPGVLSTNTAA